MYNKEYVNHNMIKQIQEALHLSIDGILGPKTKAAIIMFQRDNYLVADGIIGPKTLDALGILDTDFRINSVYKTKNNLLIHRHYLSEGEFIQNSDNTPINNEYLVLHHTAGWNNPLNTIDGWNRDRRGKIATEFVIGGQNIKNGDNTYDGIVVQSFPIGCQGWHIGPSGSRYMNRHSVGIENCNFGQLNSEFRNYVNIRADESQIVTLKKEFKGYTNWHKYSHRQLYALKKLILHIANRDNIDVRKGLIEWIIKNPIKAFDFKQDAYDGKVKGMITHANIRKDKLDLSPQPELIDMLLTI